MIQSPIQRDRPGDSLSQRGYGALYHEDEVNHCPGCGRAQWYVGRALAECAYCATALPIHSTSHHERKVFFTTSRS